MAKKYPHKIDLAACIAQLFKPVVRLAMRRGFRFQELLGVLKQACLEVSREQLVGRGQEVNTSRLAVLSGLQRKEIARIQLGNSGGDGTANLLSRVINEWSTGKHYSIRGKPRPLSFESADSEFAELVAGISVDLNPYTVLFGLEQSGDVRRRGKQLVLESRVYDASESVSDGMQILAEDSANLHAAVAENLFTKPSIPNLHISTRFNNIAIDHLDQIRHWMIDKGAVFHEEIRTYLARHDLDTNPRLYGSEGGARVSVTAFSFAEGGDAQD